MVRLRSIHKSCGLLAVNTLSKDTIEEGVADV
jgi:hypothetical protein